MSTALTATRKIVIKYTVATLDHIQALYARPGIDILGVSQILNRDGISPIAWDVAAQGAWNAIRPYLDPDVAAATAVLYDRTGAIWNPVVAATLTGVGTAAVTLARAASQLSVILRCDDFTKIRWVALEGNSGHLGHSSNGLGINSDIDVVVNDLNGVDRAANEPWTWQVSRGNRIIAATGAVAGATLDLNDKLKRTRHKE